MLRICVPSGQFRAHGDLPHPQALYLERKPFEDDQALVLPLLVEL